MTPSGVAESLTSTKSELAVRVSAPLLLVPLGPGEVLDRLTVLSLKYKAAQSERQRSTIDYERELLSTEWQYRFGDAPQVAVEWGELLATNAELWDLEDEVRIAERQENFGADFVAAARLIYRTNDKRARIKRRVNERLGSALCDFKFHEAGSLEEAP